MVVNYECCICGRAKISFFRINESLICVTCAESYHRGIVKYNIKKPKPKVNPSLLINIGKSIYNLSSGDVYLQGSSDEERIRELMNIPIIKTVHKLEGIRTVNKLSNVIDQL